VTDRPAGEAHLQRLLDLLSAGSDQPLALPSWLPPVLATLIDGCGSGAGAEPEWLRRIGGRLRDSGGAVPFAVVHDWQAHTVLPMLLAVLEASSAASASGGTGSSEGVGSSEAFEAVAALQRLHGQATAGEPAEAPVWEAALRPVLHQLYRLAYDYAGSYATAHASASTYATANNFSPAGAVSFAESYAAYSAEANRQSFAESNAPATAAALAAAYAQHGSTAAEVAYAEAYPFALVRACARASTGARAAPDSDEQGGRGQAAYLRLADGLADSLARVG
jgi:hypothetical protein